MLYIIRRYIPKFIKESPKTTLGRWGTTDNSDIKSILANYDNCGDTICKDPQELNKAVQKAYLKKKNRL